MNHPPFVITRHLKAPRQLVWDVYSQAEHLLHWFGPKGVTMSHSAMDKSERPEHPDNYSGSNRFFCYGKCYRAYFGNLYFQLPD